MLGPSTLRKRFPSYRRLAARLRAPINRSVRRLFSRPSRPPKLSDQGRRRPQRRLRCSPPCISWMAGYRTSFRYRPSRHSDRTPNDNLGRLCRRTRQTPGWRGGIKRRLWKVATSCHQSALSALAQRSQIWDPKGREPLPLAAVDSSGSTSRNPRSLRWR
jgi:hypothetical protein